MSYEEMFGDYWGRNYKEICEGFQELLRKYPNSGMLVHGVGTINAALGPYVNDPYWVVIDDSVDPRKLGMAALALTALRGEFKSLDEKVIKMAGGK